MYNLLQGAFNPGDEVIVPAPYWLSYPAMIELSSGKPKIVKMTEKEGFKLTPQKLKNAITRKTKAILLNSPSNPTGATYSKEELENLSKILESANMWILSDEAYCDILYDGMTFFSPVGLSKKIHDKTVIFRTCSKSYAMTGWRVGFSTGPKEVMKAIGDLQSQATSGINAFAQKGAVSAFTEQQSQDGLKVMVKTFAKRRDLALKLLEDMPGVKPFKPEGAFYLFLNVASFYGKKFKGRKISNSTELSEYLLDQAKVAVMPGAPFGDDKYIRLSFATSEENIEKGLTRMKEAFRAIV